MPQIFGCVFMFRIYVWYQCFISLNMVIGSLTNNTPFVQLWTSLTRWQSERMNQTLTDAQKSMWVCTYGPFQWKWSYVDDFSFAKTNDKLITWILYCSLTSIYTWIFVFFYYFVWYNVSKTKNQIQQPSTDHRRSKWLDELKSYNVHSNSWNVMWKSFKAIESLWTSYWKKWQTQKPAGHTQATR